MAKQTTLFFLMSAIIPYKPSFPFSNNYKNNFSNSNEPTLHRKYSVRSFGVFEDESYSVTAH